MSGPSGEDILFVGDIQGCRDPLERLLREAGYQPDRHRLIPVGDAINRGPDNLGVLRLLRNLGAEPILGNHEARLLELTRSAKEPDWLLRQSVGKDLLPSPERDSWLEWMDQWPTWLREEGWLAVHAGLHPTLALEQTSRDFLVHVRVCDDEGNVPAAWDSSTGIVPDGFRPWHDFYLGTDIVVYGHWAAQGLHRTANTVGLDSGCVYGGSLSGWWQRADRIVQVTGQH